MIFYVKSQPIRNHIKHSNYLCLGKLCNNIISQHFFPSNETSNLFNTMRLILL